MKSLFAWLFHTAHHHPECDAASFIADISPERPNPVIHAS
jgi:hypothetical protein